MAVNPGVNHVVVDVNAKLADDKDAEAVSNDGQRDDEERQQGPPPVGAQKEVAGQEAGDQ